MAISVKETADKGYIVVGRTNSPESGDADVYIKTRCIWESHLGKTYGGKQDDIGGISTTSF